MRIGEITRKTKETDIRLRWNLDGTGRYMGTCKVGFFDHMMQAFCVHGGFDMDLDMKGDLEVDCHHSIEDLGIVMGRHLSRLSEIRVVSAGTAASLFPWMRHWDSVPWI